MRGRVTIACASALFGGSQESYSQSDISPSSTPLSAARFQAFLGRGAARESCEQITKCVNRANNPLLVRRSGCASKKMSRSDRSGADGVVKEDANPNSEIFLV